MMPDWSIVGLRYTWTLVFVGITLVTGWNVYDALIDYWGSSQEDLDDVQRNEALSHDTRGSAYAQIAIFVCALCGLIAGIASIQMVPALVLVCFIVLGLGLGFAAVSERRRRQAVHKALK